MYSKGNNSGVTSTTKNIKNRIRNLHIFVCISEKNETIYKHVYIFKKALGLSRPIISLSTKYTTVYPSVMELDMGHWVTGLKGQLKGC